MARSENYGLDQVCADCAQLRSAFLIEAAAESMCASERQREAEAVVRKHLGAALHRLEQALGNAEEASRESSPVGQSLMCESLRAEVTEFVQSFVPALDYDEPGQSDPFDDPLIFVCNYKELKSVVAKIDGACLQVRF